jgi:8-oxo-dGTP diphosphatase
MPSVLVVAGVIEREGRILIAQRRRGGRHELKWEFPGGKVEPGEEPHAALERELREELAIEATIGEEMAREQVAYPGRRRIELIFYRVTEFQGEPQNLDFEQIVWAARDELQSYDFLEGDLPFVTKLARGTLYN